MAAESVAAPDDVITAVTVSSGPKEIASPEESAAQAPAVLAAIRDNAAGTDVAIIAAFSDPGLDEARRTFDFPVIGIGQALLKRAARAGRFVLIVPNPINDPIYRRQIDQYGVAERLIRIRYLYPLLQGRAKTPELMLDLIADQARKAAVEDRAEVVAVGGGPLAGVDRHVASAVTIPVFESITSAVIVARDLGAYGL